MPVLGRQGFYLVLTTPLPGMHLEYHAWYTERHIPDILAVEGVEFARRFEALSRSPNAEGTAYFAAIYGLSDIDKAMAELRRRRGTPLLSPSDSVDRSRSKFCVFDGDLQAVKAICRDQFLLQATGRPVPGDPPASRVFPASSTQHSDGPGAYSAACLLDDMTSCGDVSVDDVYQLMPISPLFERT